MKYFFFILLLFTLSTSCKKDIINTKNVVSANFDKPLLTFGANVHAYNDNLTGSFRLRVFGYAGSPTTTNYISLTVVSQSAIQKGSYMGALSPSYIYGSSINYVGDNPSTMYESNLNPIGSDNSVINITYIDSLTVQGTFSGTVYYPFTSVSPISITNGAFNAIL